MMQDREKIILEVLKKVPKQNVVLIGGYGINAYVPPRFSIDCDLVVLDDLAEIEATLRRKGFVKAECGDVPYGNYIRYFREKEKVSFDLLVNSVLDRDTGIVFEGDLFKKYSKERGTVGKVNPIRIDMRIADPEILFAVKFVSARRQDIRDIFMLAGEDLIWDLVAERVSEKCSSDLIVKRSRLIRRITQSKSYRDSLQGAYGKMPDERFDLCKRRLVEFLHRLAESDSSGQSNKI